MKKRFAEWRFPVIPEGKPTKYHWLVQNRSGLSLGRKTDIGAFTYIQAQNGVTIEDGVQVGSHCAIYSVSTIDGKAGPVTTELFEAFKALVAQEGTPIEAPVT